MFTCPPSGDRFLFSIGEEKKLWKAFVNFIIKYIEDIFKNVFRNVYLFLFSCWTGMVYFFFKIMLADAFVIVIVLWHAMDTGEEFLLFICMGGYGVWAYKAGFFFALTTNFMQLACGVYFLLIMIFHCDRGV